MQIHANAGLFFVAVAAIGSGLPAPAIAQTAPGQSDIMVVKGECSRLVVGETDYSSGCGGEVASTTLADGTVLFIFDAGTNQVRFGGDEAGVFETEVPGTAKVPISFADVGPPGGTPELFPASGVCTFTDPFDPVPALIECRVTTDQGPIEGLFRSDGNPPVSR